MIDRRDFIRVSGVSGVLLPLSMVPQLTGEEPGAAKKASWLDKVRRPKPVQRYARVIQNSFQQIPGDKEDKEDVVPIFADATGWDFGENFGGMIDRCVMDFGNLKEPAFLVHKDGSLVPNLHDYVIVPRETFNKMVKG